MLTKKQIQLLDFIHKRMAKDGVPPSFDEMKDALGLRSKSGIHRLVKALEERGFIRRLPHRARALEILRLPDSMSAAAADIKSEMVSSPVPKPHRRAVPVDSADSMELPVMGRISAGVPIEAIAEISRHVSVPASMLSAHGLHFALEVQGDSMVDAGILDGDVVVIREQGSAEAGDIVVALVEGQEATLKRYRRKGAMIALEAANPNYETRLLPETAVKVQGRLVGLVRTY